MMRPQVRVLYALVITMFLLGSTGLGQGAPGEPGLLEAVMAEAQAAEVQTTETQSESDDAAKADEAATDAPEESAGDETESTGDETQSTEDDATEAEDEKPAKPPLSSEMAAFRDQVRRTLSQVYSRSLSAQSNLPAEIIAFCEAFGHTAEIASGSRTGQKLNGVGSLCWNYPCGGYKLLLSDGKQVVARVGYGYQQRPGQLLAMLARNRVPPTYEVRIGDHHATVADLVAGEKRACRSGLDLSGVLIGLAFYTKPGESWENDLGDTWSVERLLTEEMDRKADSSSADVIYRLMAISYAAKELDDEDTSDDALLERAKSHVKEFHDYALGLQNSDGSWHPGFFAFRGPSKDSDGTLRSTGTILTWLVYSLPEERLEDERVVRGLSFLNKHLSARSRSRTMPSSTRQIAGMMNAARALSLYDVRYFTPRTPPKPAEEATAAKPSGTVTRSTAGQARSTYPSSSRQPSSQRSSSRRRR